MKTKNYDTSPGMLLILSILFVTGTFFMTRSCTEPIINSITKTEVKTDIKRVHHTDTVYIVQNGHTSSLVRPITEADSNLVTQTFDVLDSLLEARIKTVSKDSVLSMDLDYNIDQLVVTNTDTLFITNTITHTIENTIQEQPKLRFYVGGEMAASKNTYQLGPVVTMDLKRKALISARLIWVPGTSTPLIGGGIQIPLGKK